MPLLDVSFVLDDPMFNNKFKVIRTTRKPVKGRIVYTQTEIETSGVLTAVKSEDLNRLPSADRAQSPIYCYTKTELSTGSEEMAPDEIVFRDKVWQVKEINDWHEYGNGFYRALCIERDPTV